jgi:hypothetical protein
MPQAARAMRDGAIDAFLVAGGVPLRVLSGLGIRPGIRLLPPTDLLPRSRGGAGQTGSGPEAVTVPAGAYCGTPEVATISGPGHPVPRRPQPDLHRCRSCTPGRPPTTGTCTVGASAGALGGLITPL